MHPMHMRKAVAELAEAVSNSSVAPSQLLLEVAEAWSVPTRLLRVNFERRHGNFEGFSSKTTKVLWNRGWVGTEFSFAGEDYIFLGIAPRPKDHFDTFRARRIRDDEELEFSWIELRDRIIDQLDGQP